MRTDRLWSCSPLHREEDAGGSQTLVQWTRCHIYENTTTQISVVGTHTVTKSTWWHKYYLPLSCNFYLNTMVPEPFLSCQPLQAENTQLNSCILNFLQTAIKPKRHRALCCNDDELERKINWHFIWLVSCLPCQKPVHLVYCLSFLWMQSC